MENQVNRHEWEAQIYASNMNTTAKMVALAMGQHGSWVDDRPVEPGLSRVADMCSMSRDTVTDYVNAMVEQGYLKPLGKGKYNTTKYEMMPVVADAIGILAKRQKKMSQSQLQNLSTTTPKLVAETNPVSCRNEPELVAETNPLVADSICTNIEEHTKNIEEHSTTTTAKGGGSNQEDLPLGEDVPTLPNSSSTNNIEVVVSADATTTTQATFNKRDMVEAFIGWFKYIPNRDSDFEDKVKTLVYDRSWQPDENLPNRRLSKAVEEINKERGVDW